MITPAKALHRQIRTLLGRLTIPVVNPTKALNGEIITVVRLTILGLVPTTLRSELRAFLGRLTIL